MERSHKKNGFLIFMIIWVLLLSAAGCAVILFLRNYLTEYESSRPEKIIKEYESQVLSGALDQSCFSAVLNEVDSYLQSEDEAMAFIRDLLSGAKFYKAVEECTDDVTVYRIKNGTDLIGRAVITPCGETAHGFRLWSVSSAEFYLEQYLQTCETTVPEDYKVLVNGKFLSPSYISQDGIKYGILSAFYESYANLPTLVRFTSGKVLGTPEMRIEDSNGNTVEKDALTEANFLSVSCKADREEELRALTSDFVSKYADYTSNVTGYTTANYSAIKTLVIPDSDLHNRLRLAFDAMGFIWAKKCEVTKEKINIVCKLGTGLYMTDVSYTVDSDGGISDSNIRLIIVPDGQDVLKAETMSTY